jgi:hypothetical protein
MGSIPNEVIRFLDRPNPCRIIVPVSTQPLAEKSTGGKGQLVRKADNPIATCEPSRKCGSLDISQSYEPKQSVVRGRALPSLHYSSKDL